MSGVLFYADCVMLIADQAVAGSAASAELPMPLTLSTSAWASSALNTILPSGSVALAIASCRSLENLAISSLTFCAAASTAAVTSFFC